MSTYDPDTLTELQREMQRRIDQSGTEEDDLDFGESPFEKWAKGKGVAYPWGDKYEELAREYFGDDGAVDAFRPGGSSSRPKANPAPDWGTSWEAHLGELGKDELQMDPLQVRIMALQFDETFTKKRIAEGRLEGAEARAARQVNQRIAHLRNTLDSAEHVKHRPEYGAALEEMGKLEQEREVTVHLAPYEGETRDAIRQLARGHKHRAEELLEKYEALDPKKFPERRRSLLRQMIAENLAVSRAEIADKLLYNREQWAAIQKARQEHDEHAGKLKQAVEKLTDNIRTIEGNLKDPKLSWEAQVDLRADLAKAKDKLERFTQELRRVQTEGSSKAQRDAARAVRK